MDKLNEKIGETVEKNTENIKETVDYSTFKKIKMQIGTIIEAVPVEKSKNLLKLIIDIGEEKRQIVAGISNSYQPAEVVGKQVVIVANLEPKVIRGVESKGMVLAVGEDEKSIVLLTVDKKINVGQIVR